MALLRPSGLVALVNVEVPVMLLAGRADAGTWTPSITSGGIRTITRTAGASSQSFWIDIPTEHSNGTGSQFAFIPVGARLLYTVATANAADVRCEIWRRGRTGGAVAAGVLGGDQNADYDAAHDTAAERGAMATNTEATVTIPEVNQTCLETDQNLAIRIFVNAAATTAVTLNDVVFLGQRYIVL